MPNLLPDRVDPYGSYKFYIEWNGIVHAGFKSCSGLSVSQDIGGYREGHDPLTSRKLPGVLTYENIALERGITYNAELWEWHEKLAQGKSERREVSIVLQDDTGTEQIRWNLTKCWISSWSGPSFDAMASDTALESVELAHEGIVKYEAKKP